MLFTISDAEKFFIFTKRLAENPEEVLDYNQTAANKVIHFEIKNNQNLINDTKAFQQLINDYDIGLSIIYGATPTDLSVIDMKETGSLITCDRNTISCAAYLSSRTYNISFILL